MVEMVFFQTQVRKNRGVQTFCTCILFPDIQIRFYIDTLYTVKCHNVKFSGRFVVFDRISGGYDDPSRRNRMSAEGLILKKLQHSRNQCFGDAVDLINKKNAFTAAGLFDLFVNGSNDLTHRIFCDRILFSLKLLFYDDGKSDSTLSCVVCDRIRDKTDRTFFCGLFHDCGLANTRRTDQKDWTLTDSRHKIMTSGIFSCVDLYCMKKFLFCFFYIHKKF